MRKRRNIIGKYELNIICFRLSNLFAVEFKNKGGGEDGF
jgi:hypothetical protein